MPRSPLTRIARRLKAPEPAATPLERELAFATPGDRRIIEAAIPYTMTGVARLQALIDAVRYCERRGLPGVFAECGVWRGGSVLTMILTLQSLGVDDRELYLYDTFEGMTEPTEHDVSPVDPPALDTWQAAQREEGRAWSELFDTTMFNEADVRATIAATGYPEDRIHFVRGPVEETLPAAAPAEIALLRLDTDWYESTLHELTHLYPVLVTAGVLIIDDYGHWEGSRRAADEYFADPASTLLLGRIDYSARLAVKQ